MNWLLFMLGAYSRRVMQQYDEREIEDVEYEELTDEEDYENN